MQDARLAAPPPIVAGSSDPLLEWALRESGSGLATLFEGSGAGLKRLRRRRGAGNRPASARTRTAPTIVEAVRGLAGVSDLVLLQWAWRDQGLIVRRGNPLGLSSVGDLASKAPRVVLRQAGSGAGTCWNACSQRPAIPRSALNVSGRPA